jgi:drug/metabolite transporter (DMT)-like permease
MTSGEEADGLLVPHVNGQRVAGLGLAMLAATLWALGGVAAQVLFSQHHIDPSWLTGIRMVVGGLLLLAVCRPAWPRRDWLLLLAVAVLGIVGAQYTFYVAIDKSNVALATFAQYSAVAMTAAWQLIRRQVRPTPRRLAAVASAAIGVWLIAAAPGQVHVSPADLAGIAFGLVSAVAYCFYMLAAPRLVRRSSPTALTAWGLTVGSIPMLAWQPPWTASSAGDPVIVIGLIAFVAVGATAAAYALSAASLRWITPTEFAVTSTLEPALAAVIAAVALGVTLHSVQYAGGALTVIAVLLLAPADSGQ